MAITYRKTAKGMSEIETRQHRLAPRARSVLILVDGKRDVLQLKALILQHADETLALLLEQGMIELGAKAGLTADAPEEPGVLAVDIQLAIQSVPGELAAADFTTRQRAAVRDLNNVLGPSGESLAIRMERARHVTELRELLRTAAQIIGNARGRAAADAFLAQHDY